MIWLHHLHTGNDNESMGGWKWWSGKEVELGVEKEWMQKQSCADFIAQTIDFPLWIDILPAITLPNALFEKTNITTLFIIIFPTVHRISIKSSTNYSPKLLRFIFFDSSYA